MKKLLILSGKGGTGKTTTAAAFIRFSKAEAFADCDVDAPNLHLVTEADDDPMVSDYYGSDKASIDPEKCLGCGSCSRHCRFHAIHQVDRHYEVNEFACEGCGVCLAVCPAKAVTMNPDISGKLTLSLSDRVFSSAELKMGRGNSGKLVSAVKKNMVMAAPEAELAIIDGSPGIGCPVIASVSGVDLVLIVTEPSNSGRSDLERLLNTAGILRTRTAVCVNKYDACPEKAEEIKAFCQKQDIPFMGMIPYDRKASEAINEGKSIADTDCPMRDALLHVYEHTMALLRGTDSAEP